MDNWLRSRLHLTQRLQKQIEQRVGPGLGVPSVYRNEFERCFRGSWRVRRPHFLLTRCRKAQFLYLADFHALKQSQRGHLRLLKQLPSEEWGLALECVETQHQKYLDQYLDGKLSESDFLKKTDWRERWEFPWENYRIFFDWARENKVPVLALNLYLKESSQASLLHRDRHAAEVLSHALLARERPRWVVIFGEQHLAPQHLPLEVKRFHPQVASLVVFQNRDNIFFDLLKKGRDVDSDVVELANGHFLVSNIPPWVKWQDYLLHLERTSDQSWSHASSDRENSLDGEGLELSDDISQLVRVLAQDLEVSEPAVHLEIYTSLDKKFWKWIQRKLKLHEKMWVQDWIESGLSFYLPQFQVGYLARFSLNHSSQIAMSVLHSEKAGWREISISPAHDFLTLIWREAFQYFGSKLLNPRRKTDTLMDLKALLAQGKGRELDSEPLRLALAQKMREHFFLNTGQLTPLKFQARRKKSYFIAARMLGGMLGEKLYSGFRNSKRTHSLFRRWLSLPLDSSSFEAIYFECLESVESWPEHFRSKRERL